MKSENVRAVADFDRRAIPPEAVEAYWTCSDGFRIRRIDWPLAVEGSRGSLLFLPGRSDFYEKYLESLDHWYGRGWRVTSADWRGQAGSGRLGLDSTTGHIDDFATWVGDLAGLWQAWKVSTPAPHVLVAHSMGGHISLRALAEGRIDPVATVLTAPMLSLLPGLGFIPTSWLHRFARFMASKRDPRRSAWQGSERPGWNPENRFKRLTHDSERYADETWWWTARPQLAMGAPSWGWIEAALSSSALLRSPGILEAIHCPVQLLATRADKLVDYGVIRQAVSRIPGCRLETFGNEARHELLREEDKVRDKVIALIDAFLDAFAPKPD